jgi:hypothetical protein
LLPQQLRRSSSFSSSAASIMTLRDLRGSMINGGF